MIATIGNEVLVANTDKSHVFHVFSFIVMLEFDIFISLLNTLCLYAFTYTTEVKKLKGKKHRVSVNIYFLIDFRC